jgi:isoquinoline 1-oxidoreductase beta subunit
MNRRAFLASAAAAGGALALGFDIPLGPRTIRASESASEITVWIVIEPDDTVIIRVAKSEMGQGSFTALPMLVAEELECDWNKVKAEFASPHENRKRNRAWGNMSTGASRSITASQNDLRRAGATARELLIAAAAAAWNVPAKECIRRQQRHHPWSERTHHDLRQCRRRGRRHGAARTDPLKDPKDWKLIGTRQRRLDVPDKVTGKPIYAIDVHLPGMLYAAIVQCPVFKGTLRSVDEAELAGMKGIRRVVKLPDAVAVVADNWWRAKKAAEALSVTWDFAGHAGVSSDTIREQLHAGLSAGDARVGRNDGDVDRALGQAVKRIEADYEVPFLGHATMEPQNCTAHVTPDRVEIWAPTQDGETALAIAADAAGVSADKVVVNKMMLGCGFGRRGIFQDFVRQAVLIAKEVSEPVKLVWTREEDTRHGFYRPVASARMTAGLDADGIPDSRGKSARPASPSSRRSPPASCSSGSIATFSRACSKTCPTTCRTIAWISPCAIRMCPSASGAVSTTRRTRSSRKVSSTRWLMPREPTPICSGARCWHKKPKELAVLDAAAARAEWGSSLPRACFAALRSTIRKAASVPRSSRPRSTRMARCACTG